MKTLEDAWRWYVQTKRQVFLVRRLADLHWSELPWDGRLGNDDHFKELDPEQLKDDADFNLSQFDDLAVLVLFAVFESLVRDQLGTEIRAEIEEKGISHALLLRSFQEHLPDTRALQAAPCQPGRRSQPGAPLPQLGGSWEAQHQTRVGRPTHGLRAIGSILGSPQPSG
jgi:hypothetical protein